MCDVRKNFIRPPPPATVADIGADCLQPLAVKTNIYNPRFKSWATRENSLAKLIPSAFYKWEERRRRQPRGKEATWKSRRLSSSMDHPTSSSYFFFFFFFPFLSSFWWKGTCTGKRRRRRRRRRRKKVFQSIRRPCRNTSCAVVFSFLLSLPLSHTNREKKKKKSTVWLQKRGKLYLDEMLGPSEQSQGGVSGGFRS